MFNYTQENVLPLLIGCIFTSSSLDLYCPSVQSSLTDRICKVCNAYFASITMLKNHHKIHQTLLLIRLKLLYKIVKVTLLNGLMRMKVTVAELLFPIQ